MDKKYPANLDPKLKEAYERVMGTSTTPASKGPHEKPKPQPPVQAQPPTDLHAQAPMKIVTEEIHTPQHKEDKPNVVHLNGNPEKEHPKNQPTKQTPSGAMAMILGIVAVLFFIGYALLWAQILGVTILPF